MIRRRRPSKEIHFSFDSFLDLVANVVGIILRLILIAWVGARSYSSFTHTPREKPAPIDAQAEALKLEAGTVQDLEQHRRHLAVAGTDLRRRLDELERARQATVRQDVALAALAGRRRDLEQQAGPGGALDQAARGQAKQREQIVLSLAEIQRRSRQLRDEIDALRRLPPAKKTLRYRTPVSRPLQSEELIFECRRGRIAFIDIGALLQEVKQDMQDKSEDLKTQWTTGGVAGPVGGFRLRYEIERERGLIDGMPGAAPEGGGYRYGLSRWEVQPVVEDRGEDLQQALAARSDFRRLIDGIDPNQTAVTFWVYPDSFPMYRRLRDYCMDRDILVAGRPLPEGVPISGSRQGTVSRGQ
jgi:hypothetical protein